MFAEENAPLKPPLNALPNRATPPFNLSNGIKPSIALPITGTSRKLPWSEPNPFSIPSEIELVILLTLPNILYLLTSVFSAPWAPLFVAFNWAPILLLTP